MENGKITKFRMPGIEPFDFQIKYSETNPTEHWHEIDLHSHNKFEIYINLSGDVSFLVEHSLYPLSRGDVIIARPGEWHHCVYRSNKPHKLFWILFDCQKNFGVLDFLQEATWGNHISPQDDLREELLGLCFELYNGALTEEEKIYSFFRIFAILKKSNSRSERTARLSKEVTDSIDYINSHICEEITVAHIANTLYISQSTLQRRFKAALTITPMEFIRRKKLVLAAKMLREGSSVLTAGTSVGYNDNSYFIELFKRYYGITPYQFKRKRDNHSQ